MKLVPTDNVFSLGQAWEFEPGDVVQVDLRFFIKFSAHVVNEKTIGTVLSSKQDGDRTLYKIWLGEVDKIGQPIIYEGPFNCYPIKDTVDVKVDYSYTSRPKE